MGLKEYAVTNSSDRSGAQKIGGLGKYVLGFTRFWG